MASVDLYVGGRAVRTAKAIVSFKPERRLWVAGQERRKLGSALFYEPWHGYVPGRSNRHSTKRHVHLVIYVMFKVEEIGQTAWGIVRYAIAGQYCGCPMGRRAGGVCCRHHERVSRTVSPSSRKRVKPGAAKTRGGEAALGSGRWTGPIDGVRTGSGMPGGL